MTKNEVALRTEEKLPMGQNILLALQHVFIAILSGIPVPLIVSEIVGLSPADTAYFIGSVIFTTGICTILASSGLIKFAAPKIPLVMGISFSVITVVTSTLLNAATHAEGFQLIAGSTIISGIFCFLIAPLWSKIERLFPMVVIATNLMILSIALVPNAFNWIVSYNADGSGAVDPKAFYMALFVFVLNVILSKFLKGFLGNLTVLFSLLIGTIVSIAVGMADFSAMKDAAWFGIPLPFKYGMPKFELSSMIAFLIVMILGMVEISGTIMGIHNISGKELNQDQLTKTLRVSGINTVISGVFNSSEPVSFIQNVGILDLSKQVSRFITLTAGIILAVLSLFPKFAYLVAAIPSPVLGGIGFATFGIIVASGVDLMKMVDFEGNNNKLIIGLSVAVAMVPAVLPNFYGNFPQIVQDIFGNGILAGSIVAVVLNLFFNWKDVVKKD